MEAPLIKNPITDEQRENLLCCALEGGSNYWYFITDEAYDQVNKYRDQAADADNTFVSMMWRALKAGEIIPIHDVESDEDDREELGKISMQSIYEGEALMVEKHPEHFADIVSEREDATTGDVWFQLALMKEIVYG